MSVGPKKFNCGTSTKYFLHFRDKSVNVEFICVDGFGKLSQNDLQALNDAAKGIQLTQRIVGNLLS